MLATVWQAREEQSPAADEFNGNRQPVSARVFSRSGSTIDIVKARFAGLHKPVNPYDTQD
jgi:hypothetical protein